jgi:hypothetical protein
MKLTGNQTISGTKTFYNNSIVISGSHGTISFMDTTSGEDNFYLHANSNNFYILVDRDATDAIDGGYDNPHALQLEGDTNTAYVFGNALNISNWNTAHGWGDHGAAGYLTSFDITAQTDSKYLRSNAADTATHRVIFSGCETNNHDTIATSTGSLGSIEIYNSGTSNDAFMTFHTGSDFALYFGLDAGTNKLSVGGWSMGANSYEIYHAGNLPSLATLGYTGATNANYITNNNQLTNGAAYITGLTVASVTNVEGIFNNQRRNHQTQTNFNDTSLRAGVNYLQGGTNGPTNTSGHQWYGFRMGLGADYGTQTGSSGHYAQEWFVARKGQGGNNTGGNFLWTRDMESGSWGSWAKIDTDRLQLASGYYVSQGDWGLRNTTPSGWIQLGPANTSHAHIYTDLSNFYFNKQIQL